MISRNILLFLFCLHLPASPCFSQSPRFLSKNWELVWYDGFENAEPDTGNWSAITGVRRDGTWTADAVSIEDSLLVITVFRKDSLYYSGAIQTKGKFEWTFGYWEVRCRLPVQEGHWPAFWLLTETFGQTLDPAVSGAEIDVMEYHALWGDSCQHAVHWNGYNENLRSKHKRVKAPGISRGFHTFGLRWTKGKYTFFVDGKKTWTCRKGVSHTPQYIILSEEIGVWAGSIERAVLPDRFEVDYVKVFRSMKDAGR